jgi:micrococcal nuclease
MMALGAVVVVLVSRHKGKETQARQHRAPLSPQHLNSEAVFNATSAQPRPFGQKIEGKAYVVDGDTIVIAKTQIRLFGVDAPELNHPLGQKAKWALVNLCKDQIITAEILETDGHGRAVARCHLTDGRDLSAELVKQGLAIDWPKFSGGIYKHFETSDARKKLWLADARQKGHVHLWESFEKKRRVSKDD